MTTLVFFQTTNVSTANYPYKILSAAVGSSTQSEARTIDDTLPIFKLDQPFIINLPSLKKQLVVSSAIHLPLEGRIMFVVKPGHLKANKRQYILQDVYLNEEVKEIPSGFRCAFAFQVAGTLGTHVEATELTVHAVKLRYYGSSDIWTCKTPNASALSTSNHTDTSSESFEFDYDSVTVTLPSNMTEVEHVYGTGTFQLRTDLRQAPNRTRVVSCGKTIFFADDVTLKDMEQYFRFYRRLGLEHFTLYLIEGHPGLVDVLAAFQKAAEGYNDISVFMFPTSYTDRHLYFHPKDFQALTTNDCLWRGRANRATWTMMLFDLDEYLFRISDLPAFLSAWPHDVLSVKQYLPQQLQLLVLDSTNTSKATITVAASSKPMPKWVKTIFRTEKVEVAWVHAPTKPKLPTKVSDVTKLQHYRRNRTKMTKHF